MPLCGQHEPVGFRGIFHGKLCFEQNLLGSGEQELCCPFPCFGVLCDSHVTRLLLSAVSLWVSGSPSVPTAQSTRAFRPALTLPLQVTCEGLGAAEQVHCPLAVAADRE